MGETSAVGIERRNPIKWNGLVRWQGQQVARVEAMVLIHPVELGQLGFVQPQLGGEFLNGGGLLDLHPDRGGLDGRQGGDQKICWV